MELPSQFMENWCWEEEALAFISGHYETGEPLPKKKTHAIVKSEKFQAAMFILRQLEFGILISACITPLMRKKPIKFWIHLNQ